MTNFQLHVQAEVTRVNALHGPFANIYEAAGVLLEEIDEFKAEVWKKHKDRNPHSMSDELIQVAATIQTTVDSFNLIDCPRNLGSFTHRCDSRRKYHDLKISSVHHGYMLILAFFERFKSHVFADTVPNLDLFQPLFLSDLIDLEIIVELVATELKLVPLGDPTNA